MFLKNTSLLYDNDEQAELVTRFCRINDLKIVHTVQNKAPGSYWSDNDLRRILFDLKKRDISKVVVSRMSNLGNREDDILNIIKTLNRHKISICFVDIQQETLDEEGELTENACTMIYALEEIIETKSQAHTEKWLKSKAKAWGLRNKNKNYS